MLGSLIAEVAHTLPVPITGLATDEAMVKRLELERSDYEGPTGIVGVIHDRCRAAGLPSASLWAAVPHYVAAVPNPKAALALSEQLEGSPGSPPTSPASKTKPSPTRNRSAGRSPPTPRSKNWSTGSRPSSANGTTAK